MFEFKKKKLKEQKMVYPEMFIQFLFKIKKIADYSISIVCMEKFLSNVRNQGKDISFQNQSTSILTCFSS